MKEKWKGFRRKFILKGFKFDFDKIKRIKTEHF